MSDRNVITTTVFIAGIMLGAFTVQLKDQISLRIGTLGFNAIVRCAATGPWKKSRQGPHNPRWGFMYLFFHAAMVGMLGLTTW
jgi:hypothetical protein